MLPSKEIAFVGVFLMFFAVVSAMRLKPQACDKINFDLRRSKPDYEAFLRLKTNSLFNISIFYRNAECIDCKLIEIGKISNKTRKLVSLKTDYPYYYFTAIREFTEENMCFNYQKKPFKFEKKGIYGIFIEFKANHEYSCHLRTLCPAPDETEAEIFAVFFGISCVFVFIVLKIVIRRCNGRTVIKKINDYRNPENGFMLDENNQLKAKKKKLVRQKAVNEEPKEIKPEKEDDRFRTIDVQRGICLCLMIFVNYGAGGYSILAYIPWNGIHLADVVFPTFVFIMGMTIPISLKKMIDKSTAETSHFCCAIRVLKRTICLFAIGVLTGSEVWRDFPDVRILGILQRISIAYLICATMELIHLKFNDFKYEVTDLEPDSLKAKFQEFFLYPFQIILMLLFLIAWVLITFLLPVPGCPRGYLGPGGWHKNNSYENCTGGAAGYIDRYLLGDNYLAKWNTFESVYYTNMRYDSEGILGCLTCCALAYFGVFAGHVLVHYPDPLTRTKRFIIYSAFTALCAFSLCKFSRDHGWIPINKNLWTISFVLLMNSVGIVSFMIIYAIIDINHLYSGRPFNSLGKNSLLIYVGHLIFPSVILIYSPSQSYLLLILDFFIIFFWTGVAKFLDHKEIYLVL